MAELIVAMALFVGTHFLMSHPLRARLVRSLGTNGFLGAYSLISIGLFVWAILTYGKAPDAPPLWFVYFPTVIAAHILMWLASILFIGSFLVRNPALVGAEGTLSRVEGPKGVLRITRHPMMWSFALWAVAHIAVLATPATIVLAGGVGFLALVGAWAQDQKKRALIGEAWAAYTAHTTYWPRPRWPGLAAIAAGTLLYIFLVWLHPLAFGASTRLWTYIL
ncbi:NnrU family protein [Pacificimonas sp. ICDLI1SI03]